MDSRSRSSIPELWKVALAVALLFLALDSTARLRRIDALTSASVDAARGIPTDHATPSGLAGNQHTLILGGRESDGYEWLMQTQQMLTTGEGRVRHVDYEGPPGGRSVHWSSVLRWWTAMLAAGASMFTELSWARAVEQVSPWVNATFLVVFLVALTPLVARRFGGVQAAMFAAGTVAIQPMYALFAVGTLDHHGLAAVAAMMTVLFIIAGGGGWVRNATAPQPSDADHALWQWLPDAARARGWFIASGIAGGAGLWVSAATQIPTLIGIGVAAVVGIFAFANRSGTTWWRTEPALWRTWGISGALSSLAFWLLEYFPSHMQLRLEVNHPLHALAWLGAGDLLCRLTSMANARAAQHHGEAGKSDLTTADAATGLAIADTATGARASVLIAADLALLALVPAVVLFMPDAFVIREGSLLMWLHEDYILEFKGLAHFLFQPSWTQTDLTASLLLPLFVIGPAVFFAATKRVAHPLRALALLSLLPALAFTLLAFRHTRWMGIASTLWLATTLAVVTIAAMSWRDLRRRHAIAAGLCVALAFAPFPLSSIQKWIEHGLIHPIEPSDFAEVITRDVSQKLRARLGTEQGTIATEPATTTWMTYFGGFRGVGTLYWENAQGLQENANLFGAPTIGADGQPSDSALKVITRLGVTHIVLYSWGPFVTEYARLAHGLRAATMPTAAEDDRVRTAFGPSLLRGTLPPWIRPLAYRVPPIPGLANHSALVLEVAPLQTPGEAATRRAQYSLAMQDQAGATQLLQGVLSTEPENVPALIALARMQQSNPARGDFRTTTRRIAEVGAGRPLDLEDLIGLASVQLLGGDSTRARASLSRALADADERSVRRLPWGTTTANFVLLLRHLGLDEQRPAITSLAMSMLDPAIRAQIDSAGPR